MDSEIVSDASRSPKADREDVRAEYAALNSYISLVATFRFTIAGFFIAAAGLLSGSGVTRERALLLLAITVSLWILELRNRSLLGNLDGRAMQIEREMWGYTGAQAYDAFTCRQLKVRPANDDSAPEPPAPDKTKLFFWKLPLAVTHTLGFDLMYLSVAVFATYSALK